MGTKFFHWFADETRSLLEIRKSDKLWHTPFLAASCVGLPLLVSYYKGNVASGMAMCIGALVILYLSSGSLTEKMRMLLVCSLGFTLSYAVGLAFAFSRPLAFLVLGLFSFLVHFLVDRLRIPPPGSLLFVMIAAIAISTPYNPHSIPVRAGLLAAGALQSGLLAFFYHLVFLRGRPGISSAPAERKPWQRLLWESAVFALFVGASLGLAYLFRLQKPYWIPLSCAAVMQGTDVRHVWQRSFHRISGTLAGLGIAWLLLSARLTLPGIFIAIMALQFMADTFVARHYALVVVFFTPIAIFLAEAGSALQADPDQLIRARLIDTCIGCSLGTLGGYVLHEMRPAPKKKRDLMI